LSDHDHRDERPAHRVWHRPPVEERADQVRTWNEEPVGDLRNPALRALAEAWGRAAASEGLRPPSRAVFSPTEVVETLSRTTLLERVGGPVESGHTWRYRLVGTEIVDLVQADVTGRTIEHYHPPLAAMLRTQFDATAAAGVPKAFTVRTVVDHRPYAYEKIVLPLRSAPDAETDQIMVASFPIDAD
jgi:hypothetical protein